MVKAKPKKQPIVTVALPSVLHASVPNQQALRDAFRADLQAVLKPGSGPENDINVGSVAVDVAIVKGFGRRAPRRKPAKKAAKK